MLEAIECRPATVEDAVYISLRTRQADVDELFAACGKSPLTCMLLGITNSPEAWTGLIGGEPVCIFGVAAQSMLTGAGVPWMVGTDALDSHSYSFLHGSRAVVGAMLAKWSHLQNYVDARNTRAIRWLKFLGFMIHDSAPYGTLGLPFHHFEMRSTHV